MVDSEVSDEAASEAFCRLPLLLSLPPGLLTLSLPLLCFEEFSWGLTIVEDLLDEEASTGTFLAKVTVARNTCSAQ